jgi:hypothetical protein
MNWLFKMFLLLNIYNPDKPLFIKLYLCQGMKKGYKYMIRLFMLASGFVLLLTVVIPHHHHEGGMPCIFLWDNGETGDTEGEEHSCCDCNGHTIAFSSTTLQHSQASSGHNLFLIPLYTLFDYIYPTLTSPYTSVFSPEKAVYVESLLSFWTPAATGLRAPPFFN